MLSFYVSNKTLHSDLEIPFVQSHSQLPLPTTWPLSSFYQHPLLQNNPTATTAETYTLQRPTVYLELKICIPFI